MRLTIPEPKINLYKDGFAEHDKLSRKTTGEKLSELVEHIDDPLVIALDGAWGSGKSFFLKCWVGEHLRREGNTTQTVYFDAFKHDFLDDPLIALTGAIAERFEGTDDIEAQHTWNKAKQIAPALGRTLLRTGVSVATAGLVTTADELTDAAINTLSGELDGAVAEFWKREDGKRAAMAGFRQALVGLTEPNDEGVPTRKLVIVIDELDRCRPEFAFSLLEVVKHFFNVDGVHFVLGANLRELENSVQTRYGASANAARYLQKFVTLVAPLAGSEQTNRSSLRFVRYFDYVATSTKLYETWKYSWLQDYLKLIDHHVHLSLRDIEQLIRVAQLAPSPSLATTAEFHLFSGLAILKVISPNAIRKIRDRTISFADVTRIFEIQDEAGEHSFERAAHYVWRLAVGLDKMDVSAVTNRATHEYFEQYKPTQLIRDILANSFDTFDLTDVR
ncbi:P-loop NTPase fold protein [Ruegeria sp.]|uniref:KAP family P-loop NTPase fold protein n=1 Tax=Ruegeria sp. TaxID=1879320 RepID=UPI0023147085|nr:P-loop NTPase fold protein [Ruegeria sp.]MDA7967035.1 KAP family NTPase [Ruegeria sp.]